MGYSYLRVRSKVHRLIPSRYPTVNLFDWAESPQELEEIAGLEGLTNERLLSEYGNIHLVTKEDWVSGAGATPLMAAFTHPGVTRFSDGNYGIYYAADSLETAIAETKFHRERFLNASKEAPCLVQMRQYTSKVQRQLVQLSQKGHKKYLTPNPNSYPVSQAFGLNLKLSNEWGIHYPSVRRKDSNCVAIFRPRAVAIPVQGCHLDYIWDGKLISEVRINELVQPPNKRA